MNVGTAPATGSGVEVARGTGVAVAFEMTPITKRPWGWSATRTPKWGELAQWFTAPRGGGGISKPSAVVPQIVWVQYLPP